jgi:hypothetical protein
MKMRSRSGREFKDASSESESFICAMNCIAFLHERQSGHSKLLTPDGRPPIFVADKVLALRIKAAISIFLTRTR